MKLNIEDVSFDSVITGIQSNKYDMAIGLFYGVGIFLGIGIFFVGGFMTMSGAGWGASLFGGGCFSLVFGLICHAVITLRRNDK